jgi:hypothetical protein
VAGVDPYNHEISEKWNVSLSNGKLIIRVGWATGILLFLQKLHFSIETLSLSGVTNSWEQSPFLENVHLQLVKKFLAFYGICRFIIVFRGAHN